MSKTISLIEQNLKLILKRLEPDAFSTDDVRHPPIDFQKLSEVVADLKDRIDELVVEAGGKLKENPDRCP